ncbi:MAG: DEAD/DEAH box helicase [Methanomassiliicoccales archaeon]|nr:DEAD/DEAH box helicase [Methanomassiliicoccales archaeon]MDD1755334.1 DEAD/DEAH box helicase [Methanomassiliicoccales archaeon]
MFVEHPLIRPEAIEEREYQRTLSDIASKESTLVVLPTGMGKTVVALRVAANVLQKGGKVLFLAPTKPLVEQHANYLKEFLVGKKVGIMTGENPPEEREAIWIESDIIASTPQVVANDLRYERVDLRNVKLIIFDEAHRAVGNYAYVDVAAAYREYPGLVLGMTASPGSSRARIQEVCDNLSIGRIELRSETDPDVARYVHEIQIDAIEVEVPPEMKRVIFALRSLFERYVSELVQLKAVDPKRPANRKYLLEVGRALQQRSRSGEKHRNLFRAMSLQAMAIKVDHALELAETQGATALREYLDRLRAESESEEGSKASREIVKAAEYVKTMEMVHQMRGEHPKLSRIMTIVARQIQEKPASRIIVFTHFRDTCDLMASKLSEVEGAMVAKLVGQTDRTHDKGLKQKEQIGVLDQFRNGKSNVLVATSVGEEGLDVANTDLVIFYEPVPSEIRSIQRRGRTGRKRSGRVVVLVTRGTRDEAYLYASINKERAMKKGLGKLQHRMELDAALDKEREEDASAQDAPRKGGQSHLQDF